MLPPPPKFVESQLVTFLSAFIAGFSDLFGFIALNQLFTAHITGNLVIAISFIIFHIAGVATQLTALVVFIFAAFIFSIMINLFGKKKHLFCFCFLAEAFFYFLLMIGGYHWLITLKVGSFNYIVFCMLPVLAMAIHNTLMRTFLIAIPPYTVMTGNLTQFITSISDYYLGKYTKDTTRREKAVVNIKKYSLVLCGFAVGGGIAVIGYCKMHFWVTAIEITAMLLTAGIAYRHPGW